MIDRIVSYRIVLCEMNSTLPTLLQTGFESLCRAAIPPIWYLHFHSYPLSREQKIIIFAIMTSVARNTTVATPHLTSITTTTTTTTTTDHPHTTMLLPRTPRAALHRTLPLRKRHFTSLPYLHPYLHPKRQRAVHFVWSRKWESTRRWEFVPGKGWAELSPEVCVLWILVREGCC